MKELKSTIGDGYEATTPKDQWTEQSIQNWILAWEIRNVEDADRQFEKLRAEFVARDGHVVPLRLLEAQTLAHYIWLVSRTPGSAIQGIYRDMREALEALGAWSIADDVVLRGEAPHSTASAWTGRRSVKEVAESIQRVVPVAQQALGMLILEQERRLHNLPPEPLEAEALTQLRELHRELGELLRAVDAADGLAERLRRVAALANRVFKVGKPWGVTVRGLEVAGLSLIPTYATVKALEFMFGQPFDVAGEATVSAAMLAITHLNLTESKTD